MGNCCAGHQHDPDAGLIRAVRSELICHLPYAIFSTAISLAVLSFVTFGWQADTSSWQRGTDTLFHCFHFMHIVFAATGTIITFMRFSRNVLAGVVVGIVAPVFFCVLSDAVLPYLGGRLLGVDMDFHICFLQEIGNVGPFLLAGMLNGFVMSLHHKDRQAGYSLMAHTAHIFVSSLASAFYLVAHGMTMWANQIGFVFLFLVLAVVVPCTMSDVVVPMIFARVGKKNEKHTP